MNYYYFELIGLRVLLNTPIPLTISASLQPFVCQPSSAPTDCTIRISICEDLPRPEGLWHGPECYFQTPDALQIFYCHAPYGEAFAVTRMEGKGDVQIAVHPDYADYFSGSSGLFHRIGFENLLLQHSGLLLHASLIEFAGKTIAFAGPSGVGKSTQAGLWAQCFGARILNGDRAALRKTENGWRGYGSPYAGTSGIYRKDSAPLAAIVVLRQSKENRLRKMTGTEAFMSLWPEFSARRWDEQFVSGAMDLCEKLLSDIPVYLLKCLPEESAAIALKKGLSL